MKTNLKKYLRARRPIIWCNTSDYKEIDDLLKEAIKDINNKIVYEFRALGAVDFETKEISEEIKSLYNFLDIICSEGYENNIFLLVKNSKVEMEKHEVLAYLKKIAELRYCNPNYNFTVIVISDSNNVPKELEKFTSILEVQNMTQDEIEKYILNFGKIHEVKIDLEDIGEIAISLKGLSKLEIDHVLNMMIENKKNISISDRNIIIREKGQIIKKSAVLELIDFKEKITDIGGLEGLKEWLEESAQVFRRLDEAESYGVDTPKGVLLVGMPGCGKSLAAKATARLFNAPLLRLDIGRLLGKYVGESEYNMRVALKTAESISPCILWIDEIEKAFSGIDQSGGASDITKRLFGQFLTWLQEKENTVFVVATANDISTFPPEFLRKGRFDEVFFVDFPTQDEREKIFGIHLEKRYKNRDDFDILKLAKATEGYCGADIEEIVKLTLKRAFINGDEDIDTQDLLDNIKEIDSLSTILADKIEILKKGFEKFKIKSASKKNMVRNKKIIMKSENKNMIFVQGGKYISSMFPMERQIGDLLVSKYLVTRKIWAEENKNFILNNDENLAMSNINWLEAIKFCNKLSLKENLTPVYKIQNEVLVKIVYSNNSEVDLNKADFSMTEGYRLPTELEWEWFARGGEIAIQDGTFDTAFSGSNNPDEVALYNNGGVEMTVGTKKSNELGLYDCSGLVFEWCYDSEVDIYTSKFIPEERPYIFSEFNDRKKMRGGSSCSNLDSIFVNHINNENSRSINYLSSDDIIGFRIVRSI
ncbi:MAG: AAA family ATPase [Cetobacterium sp.]|uniref:AAA family ATPase n=1 Tax=Cetobacterium sp. TaxID=2071632 RepID=UPI003F3191B4